MSFHSGDEPALFNILINVLQWVINGLVLEFSILQVSLGKLYFMSDLIVEYYDYRLSISLDRVGSGPIKINISFHVS